MSAPGGAPSIAPAPVFAGADGEVGTGGEALRAVLERRVRELESRELAHRALVARQATLLHGIADFHAGSSLTAALMGVADGLRLRFRAERVVAGLLDGTTVTLAAISQQAMIDPAAPETRLLVDALEATCRYGDQQALVPGVAPGDGGHRASNDGLRAHRTLVAGRPGTGVLASPFCHRGQVVGALLVELAPGPVWPASKRELLQQIADTLAPMIVDRHAAERSPAARARDGLREALDALRAPRRLMARLGVTALSLGLLGLAFLPLEQRIAATAELVPERLRTVTAPITGYVRRVDVAAGDTVREGDPLFALDTRDLVLERDRWTGELASTAAELRAVRAAGDRKRTAVLKARSDQARAELALAEQRIARAQVLAPHDGQVIGSGLERLVGAAVERGERLLELAPDGGRTLELLVDERDIGLLVAGQRGALALEASPGARLTFVVSGIQPIAVAGGGRNRFRVEAALVDADRTLLPGQTGVARVDVGTSAALTLLTRRFLGWARLRLWEWFGR